MGIWKMFYCILSSDSILCTLCSYQSYASNTDAHVIHAYIGIFKMLIARVRHGGFNSRLIQAITTMCKIYTKKLKHRKHDAMVVICI